MKNFNREMESLKKNLRDILELKNIIPEIKNLLDGINLKLEIAEEWFGELKDRSVEIIQAKALLDEIKKIDLE